MSHKGQTGSNPVNMEVPLTLEMIEVAAKLTFGNVVLISLLCTVIDSMRRWFTVTRPVQRIADAAEKITEGDFSVHIQPVFSMGGQDGLNTIIHSFNRMAQELSGIETLRTDFISNVSHELKTPLAVIQNYGTMLQQPELPEELRQEYAKTVTDASRRLADLITNILKLNKLESQQIYPEKEVFDLGEQLCECLLAFEDIWEEKGMELDTDIAEDVAVRSRRPVCQPGQHRRGAGQRVSGTVRKAVVSAPEFQRRSKGKGLTAHH
ncbi:sensor histidine kinase [Neglecta sp. X4]|nr:sensor histidine kinase [Neglectibacter sp. 59]NBJ74507.1 sensor histidine kinase [Neglectibacter sp. X4]NCE82234.1 sensor histidine kinase [Neglectibacter sp. X58]